MTPDNARHGDEQPLAETQLRFQAIFDNALDAIVLFDDAVRFIDVNPSMCAMLGYSRTELTGKSLADITPTENRQQIPAVVEQFLSTKRLSGEYRLLCKDGSTCDIEYHAVAGIRPGLHLNILRDITARKSAEEKLRTSAVLMAEAQRIAHVGSWSWDIATDSVQSSDETYRIYGLRPQEIELSYDVFLKLVHPDDRGMVRNAVDEALRTGQPFDYRLRTLRQDGSIRLLQSRGRLSLDENNQPTRMYGIVHDVTEREEAVAALRDQAERLKVLSNRVVEIQEEERRHLAHELHDEIGQVLSAIAVNLQSIKQSADDSARVRLDESIFLVEQATQQVRNLSLDLRPCMLDDLGLVSTLRWYADRQTQRAGLLLHFQAESFGDSLPAHLQITCYRIVQEALTNIVRHARAHTVAITFVAREEEVKLIVRDDGVGFDLPAFRSNSRSGGSFGILGMTERVQMIGGQIDIQSEPGKGTQIRVFLPIAEN